MINKKIIIAGGTGFIGQEICNYFGKENKIIILTRAIPGEKSNSFGELHYQDETLKNLRFVKWNGRTTGEWWKELDGADMIINLAGKTVNCRYTEKNKKEILESRLDATNVIGKALQLCSSPPSLWINAASATIYPHASDTPRDESFTDFKNDFSVQVCKKWEAAFFGQSTPHTRKVALRMAITIGNGGVMIPYFNLLKFGLGGRQGNGRQMYSWIHIEDTCRMIEWIYTHQALNGIYNCCSPKPVRNNTFMQTLREATGYTFGLPAFEWMLKIGAKLIGTEAELILKSRWVLPARIQATGFEFKYPDLNKAVEQIVHESPVRRYRLF